jgi:hypothetical protein
MQRRRHAISAPERPHHVLADAISSQIKMQPKVVAIVVKELDYNMFAEDSSATKTQLF